MQQVRRSRNGWSRGSAYGAMQSVQWQSTDADPGQSRPSLWASRLRHDVAAGTKSDPGEEGGLVMPLTQRDL